MVFEMYLMFSGPGGYSSCSSGGPSSPTAISNPDAIMRKLTQLINRSNTTESGASTPNSSLDRSDGYDPQSSLDSPQSK